MPRKLSSVCTRTSPLCSLTGTGRRETGGMQVHFKLPTYKVRGHLLTCFISRIIQRCTSCRIVVINSPKTRLVPLAATVPIHQVRLFPSAELIRPLAYGPHRVYRTTGDVTSYHPSATLNSLILTFKWFKYSSHNHGNQA